VQGPGAEVKMRALEPTCAEPASPVRYRRVISVRRKEARRDALHTGPRQSRENMKQVSVRSIFGSSTHHPCLSKFGGRSRHPRHAWMETFSRSRSGCGPETQWAP